MNISDPHAGGTGLLTRVRGDLSRGGGGEKPAAFRPSRPYCQGAGSHAGLEGSREGLGPTLESRAVGTVWGPGQRRHRGPPEPVISPGAGVPQEQTPP